MRILRNNTIYVQKIDIEFLKYTLHILPENVLNGIDLDDYNKYDFIPFSNENDIEFFMKIDFIIDYSDYENMQMEKIKLKGESLVSELESITAKMYQEKLSDEEYEKTSRKYKELNHLITSLGDLCDFKDGMLKLNIPPKNKFKQLINILLKKSISKN